ncbi:MAG: host-nuclease inhibitor Gam family protein [Ignavibacteriales bacterium]|nr:host-nuclease inhibitor Gam family protein [Ignavibacteriales bacterium]
MKKNNHSHSVESLKTFDDVNAALLNLAALTLNAEKKENEMKQKILDIKKQCEPDIKELKDKIVKLEEQIAGFCKVNKREFSAARSKEFTYGRIGFRTGKWTLKFISKKFNIEFTKQKIMDMFGTKYVDIETKLNKNKVLADAKKGILSDEKLAAAGIKRTKGESSFYEINWDEIKLVDIQ